MSAPLDQCLGDFCPTTQKDRSAIRERHPAPHGVVSSDSLETRRLFWSGFCVGSPDFVPEYRFASSC
jgi:hypothetical protein